MGGSLLTPGLGNDDDGGDDDKEEERLTLMVHPNLPLKKKNLETNKYSCPN